MGAGASSGDKGKGKEVDMDVGETGVNMGSDAVPGGGEDDDEGGGGKGEKKKKNTYKHLIKGLPGACLNPLIGNVASCRSRGDRMVCPHPLSWRDLLPIRPRGSSFPRCVLLMHRCGTRKTFNEEGRLLDDHNAGSAKTTHTHTPIRHASPRRRFHSQPRRTQRRKWPRDPVFSLLTCPQWNANALVVESAQAREDRRKRVSVRTVSMRPHPLTSPSHLLCSRVQKELKRLAKAQQQQHGQQQEHVPLQAPVPTMAPATSLKSQGSGTPLGNPSTPRSGVMSGGTPRPGSAVPRPGSTISRPSTAVGTPAATPVQPVQSVAKPPVPRPGSTVPRPGSTIQGLPPRPPSTHPTTPVTSMKVSTPYGDQPRGQKRPRDEGNPSQMTNGSNGNGALNGNSNGTAPVSAGVVPPKPFLGAKAGSGGVRPRPVKKPRVVSIHLSLN